MDRKELKRIGERVRAYRISKNLSQEDTSDKVGITPKFYGMIERGEKGMSIDTLIKLKNLLDIDLEYLFFGEFRTESQLPILQLLKKIQPDQMKYVEEILIAFINSHEKDNL